MIVDCYFVYDGVVSKTLQHNFQNHEVMTGDEQIVKNSIPWAPWKFIILREYFFAHDLWFHENQRIEDVDWAHKLVHFSSVTQYLPIPVLYYTNSSISTTMTAYKSPETVYSALDASKRLHLLGRTVFADATPEVILKINQLSDALFYNALGTYYLLIDNAKKKAANIIETKNNEPGHVYDSARTKFASKHPVLFSCISNIIAPLGRVMLVIYRRLKKY